LDLVVVNLHLVQLLAPKVVVELAVELAAVVSLYHSLVSIRRMHLVDLRLQSMLSQMVAQDMMTLQ
jgi:hypothetical protein